MNKILLPLLALILAACSSPPVTVTSEMTVPSLPPTATVLPAPTLHPQFVTLQDSIAASGETFTLLPNGTLEQRTSEGAVTVPGLAVDKNGVMTLQVTLQGQSLKVTLSPEDVNFDDDTGVSVKGYTQDENGKWVEAIFRLPNGAGLEFGETRADGSREIVGFIPRAGLDSQEKMAFEVKFDDTTL